VHIADSMTGQAIDPVCDRQFLFVTCVNNEQLYRECLEHIRGLEVPDTYTVDTLPIYNAASMTSGYNQALLHGAKYKIYLHQDVFVVHRMFLVDLLRLFTSHPQLGLLGMAGCKAMPPHGVWWGTRGTVGTVNQCNTILRFGEAPEPFEPVEAVDGLLLATQYDVRWRDDLFTGFHFYDVSQSMEFRRRGFIVGVPRQAAPWCEHWDDDLLAAASSHAFEHGRQLFVSHYLDGGTRV